MTSLARIILVRHGETEGQSSIRFHGITDVPLSDEGREQIRRTATVLPAAGYDLVLASPLQRAVETARIIAPGAELRMEPAFREIDFGRWEGLTAEEIAARDPALYREWQERRAEFDFPEGERRAAFRARVNAGIDRLLAGEDTLSRRSEGSARGEDTLCALVAAHKGVLRTIVERLTEQHIDDPSFPALAAAIELARRNDGSWQRDSLV